MRNTIFEDEVSFIDADNHRAKIRVELRGQEGQTTFSASGDYLGGGGQCLEKIKPRTEAQKKLIQLWEKHHLEEVNKIKHFQVNLESLMTEIKKEEEERALKEPILEGDEKVLRLMGEYGIEKYNLDACKAYLEVFGFESLEEFDERYRGKYRDDEDFAEQYADVLGVVFSNTQWPMNCIDWEWAAREIKNDFREQDGYYFLNF